MLTARRWLTAPAVPSCCGAALYDRQFSAFCHHLPRRSGTKVESLIRAGFSLTHNPAIRLPARAEPPSGTNGPAADPPLGARLMARPTHVNFFDHK